MNMRPPSLLALLLLALLAVLLAVVEGFVVVLPGPGAAPAGALQVCVLGWSDYPSAVCSLLALALAPDAPRMSVHHTTQQPRAASRRRAGLPLLHSKGGAGGDSGASASAAASASTTFSQVCAPSCPLPIIPVPLPEAHL